MRRLTKNDITRAILTSLKISGLLAMSLVAPNAIQALKRIGIPAFHQRQNEVINSARNKLIKRGFLHKDKNGYISITDKGKDRLISFELNDYKIIIPKIWDKKWRILIFDIPEYRRRLRTKIRNTLREIGFKRLQDSVWIFPYDCEEFVMLLKADFKVGKDLLYLVVEKVENDILLRNYFNLN